MQSGVSKVVAFLKQLAGVFMCIKKDICSGLSYCKRFWFAPKEFQFKLFIQDFILNHIIKYHSYTENGFITHRCAKSKTSAHEESSIQCHFVSFMQIKQLIAF